MKYSFSTHNLQEPRTIFFVTWLSITMVAFSIFSSIYSSNISNAEVADMNMFQYALQDDTLSNANGDTYQEIAKAWLTTSELFRHKVRIRAYSTYWSFFGLIALGPTFILLFKDKRHWLIPLIASIVCLSFAYATYARNIEWQGLNRVSCVFPFIEPEIPRQYWIKQVISDNPYLEDHLKNVQQCINEKAPNFETCLETKFKER